jgi:hypothetical protein
MGNNYFSPNSKVSGGAMFATFNSKEGHVYLKMLKQVANNPDKKGNFDGKNPLHIKLSQDEAADIIRAVRINGEAKFYHKFDQTVTSGTFKHYTIAATDKFPARSGYGLSVKRTVGGKETEIKVGFTPGSAERFSLFLNNALVHIFDAEYSQDLKDYKESQAKKVAATPKEEPQESPAENEPGDDSPTDSNLDF